MSLLSDFIKFIHSKSGINDKYKLRKLAITQFKLAKEGRSVFYCSDFAVVFSSSAKPNPSNTVISLRTLLKHDDIPFLSCLVTPYENKLTIVNSTFISKVPHSSNKLTQQKIRGSFNYSNIIKKFDGIDNEPSNFESLFELHQAIGSEENIIRLVGTTAEIEARDPTLNFDRNTIYKAPQRTKEFIQSPDMVSLTNNFDKRVQEFKHYICSATQRIEGARKRGNIIEYIISGEDDNLRQDIFNAIDNDTPLPEIPTKNTLGDYYTDLSNYSIAIDIKTKIESSSSAPKGYNLNKFLEFLSKENSVFLLYFILIDSTSIRTAMVSPFQKNVINATRSTAIDSWSSRSTESRGATQFNGELVKQLIINPEQTIDVDQAVNFLSNTVGY